MPRQRAEAVTPTQQGAHFIDQIAPHAQEIASENDLYASVMLAQAALESGFGTSVLSSAPNNNLFGVKGHYNGQTAHLPTLEDTGRREYYQIVAGFRKYPTHRESLNDYVNVVKQGPAWNNMYYAGAWRSRTDSYKDATQWLTGRYATDTAYAEKLNRIIEAYDLTRFDSANYVPTPTRYVATAGTGHVVRPGETLYRIAVRHNLSVAELKRLNGLSSDSIRVGQVLQVQSRTTASPQQSATVLRANRNGGANYVVQSGDTLYRIANKLGMSVATLKSTNRLSSDVIYVGQVLSVGSQGSASQSTSAPTKQVRTTTGNYTVASGDTLYRIATRHGLSVSELKALNGLSSNTIAVGQQLKVSGTHTASVKQVASTTPTSTSSSRNGGHTVASGETLYRIATRYGVTVAALKAANGLQSDSIRVGQQLTIPSGAANVQQSASSTAGRYTVVSGDTLYAISRKTGVSVNALMRLNGLSSSTLRVGQQLRLK